MTVPHLPRVPAVFLSQFKGKRSLLLSSSLLFDERIDDLQHNYECSFTYEPVKKIPLYVYIYANEAEYTCLSIDE